MRPENATATTATSRSETFTNDSSDARSGNTNPASDVHADADYEVMGCTYSGRHSTVHRAFDANTSTSVAVKSPLEPSKRMFNKYAREFEFANRLGQNPYVIQCFKIIKYRKTQALVMEEFHGVSLQDLFQKSEIFAIEEFLRIASQLVEGLGLIHQGGVMHQQLIPKHILVNRNTADIRYIDFGLASILSKQLASAIYVRKFAGYYEWISPEQTGRMNKDVDYRTDYYTLGVIFYQMITGRVPFSSTDSARLFYAHIAKIPPAPNTINERIPPAISNIIMKLLSKSADDRYQSTYGIKMDLLRCIDEMKAGGSPDFPIATFDVQSTFQISQRLYGREEEIKTLLRAFEQVTRGQVSNKLVLVGGYSGIGKTSLINEIHKPLVRDGGYFISGKADQFARGVPYSLLVQAFQQMVKMILTEPEDRIRYWKDTLLKHLNQRGSVIIEVIPEVELIIGPQAPLADVGPSEMATRFRTTFMDFISAFSQPTHPLVIFLDDLQWSDLSTLLLMESVVTNNKIQHLMVIGTYRDNEVDESHPLTMSVKNIEVKREILKITLNRLSIDNICQLVSDTLSSPAEKVKPLAALILEKTQGNPFFVVMFMVTLSKENHIFFNTSTGQWSWDLSQIKAMAITDNVVEMMTDRIKRLDRATQEVVSLAASIGNIFDLRTLSDICGCDLKASARKIWPAVKDELLIVQDEDTVLAFDNDELWEGLHTVRLGFLHDRVQQAAYEMTPVELRPNIHLNIGRLMTSEGEVPEERLFDVLSQYAHAVHLIRGEEEKNKLAGLWLRAARKAKQSASFSNGRDYASLGISMLPENRWEVDYDRTLELAKLLAECEYLSGDYDRAEQMYPELIQHCHNKLDTASVYFIKSEQMESQQRYADCVQSLIDLLAMHDIEVILTGTNEEKEQRYRVAFDDMMKNLGSRSITDIYNATEITDQGQKDCLKALTLMWAPLFCCGLIYDQCLTGTMAVSYSFKYGNSAFSSTAFCNWTATAHRQTRDTTMVHELGVLGCSLLELIPNEPHRCRSYFAFAWSCHGKMPLNYAFPFIDRAFESAVEFGNKPYACYSGHNMVLYRLNRGTPLREVFRLYKRLGPYIANANATIYQWMLALQISLRWNTETNGKFENDEPAWMEKWGEDILVMSGYGYGKISWLFWSKTDDPAIVWPIYDLYMRFTDEGLEGFYSHKEGKFMAYMVILQVSEKYGVPQERQEGVRKFMEKTLALYEQWVEDCPVNNDHKLFLIRAETARIQKRPYEAVEYYVKAKTSAKTNQFLQFEGLANELAGRLWHNEGFPQYAKIHMEEAYFNYKDWNSSMKQKMIEKEFSQYLLDVPNKDEFEPLDTGTETSSVAEEREENDTDQLDMQTMVRMSEAISMDMSLEQLMDTMMKMIIENSGAQKGIFILSQDTGELLVVAEGDLDSMQVDTIRAVPLTNLNSNYPHSIISYVARTKETVIMGEHRKNNNFETDSYLSQNNVKSVLCAPIVRNNTFKGCIYLENNLNNAVFNDQRVKMVSNIAVQMAVHLDNAKFSQLLESEKRFRSMATELEVVKKGLEEFIDVLCHELRNPLNGIYGSKQLMMDQLSRFKTYLKSNGQGMNEPVRKEINSVLHDLGEMLEAISISSDHLKDIVDTVLTVSMLEKQSIKLQSITFNPLDVIEKVKLMYKAKLMEKGLTFEQKVPDDVCFAVGDPHRLSQVLINIISNSVKFMDKGGLTIIYEHEAVDNKIILHFTVRDTGIGLTEQELSKLFKPFSQANANISSKYGGSGLGLNITREIVDLMGGSIRLESQKGIGTSCIFHVTCDKPSREETESRKRKASVSSDSAPAAKKQARNKHILIVEDNTINQKLMKRILEMEGYTTEVADNGKEAFEKYAGSFTSDKRFDAVLMDFEMPIMNGITSTQKIRAFEVENNEENPVLIIGVSANTRDTHSQTAVGVGMNGYITKPFQKNDIFDAIERRSPRKFELDNASMVVRSLHFIILWYGTDNPTRETPRPYSVAVSTRGSDP
ncbi:putative ATPase [Planoprotostelium fungivorum]|uniref:Putative ATPase n=1 Tax=Planoprotostelium fungivorum TaxID=1890364 RepID=A0A2P6NA09_9EUKA|nr:putative ATPase [Planoprotostelium fungivorum]